MVLDVAWTLWFLLWCYIWVDIIYIWGVVPVLICINVLSSSSDEIYVRVKLNADDVWEAEYYKTGFLSVGVASFDQLFLGKQLISLPMVNISTKNGNMINEDNQ